MNYQIFPLFFTRISTLLFFLIAIGFNFIGISALISYFIIIGVIFPAIISMRLCLLNESGVALTITEDSQWAIYILGFPAQEQRSALKNIGFFSKERFHHFFLISFLGKFCAQIACIAMLICDYSNGSNLLATLFALVCLLAFASNGAWSLYQAIFHQWQYETLLTNTGSIWYQGFWPASKSKKTLFERLI